MALQHFPWGPGVLGRSAESAAALASAVSGGFLRELFVRAEVGAICPRKTARVRSPPLPGRTNRDW